MGEAFSVQFCVYQKGCARESGYVAKKRNVRSRANMDRNRASGIKGQ